MTASMMHGQVEQGLRVLYTQVSQPPVFLTIDIRNAIIIITQHVHQLL